MMVLLKPKFICCNNEKLTPFSPHPYLAAELDSRKPEKINEF
jgi:hypothetical protein